MTCSGTDELTWELTLAGQAETAHSRHDLNAIRGQLRRWFLRLPVANEDYSARTIFPGKGRNPEIRMEPPFAAHESPLRWVEQSIQAMAGQLRARFSPLNQMAERIAETSPDWLRFEQRYLRKEQLREEAEERRHETMRRLAEERRRKEEAKAAQRKAIESQRAKEACKPIAPAPPGTPLPPVPLQIELPGLAFQETAFPLDSLAGYFLRERAAQWWVSNQSDDLIALPYCRIQRLDYQVRTALRAMGPLRGRALLSDEVGLGKTIEAGLALKE